MLAISLWQPWASALFAPIPGDSGEPIKRNETRSWPLPAKIVGQRVAIHAAKRRTPDEVEFWNDTVIGCPERGFYREAFGALGVKCFRDLPLGCIIGTLVFDASFQTTGWGMVDHLEGTWGNYAPGRWAWPTRARQLFAKPIPCVGRQGFFEWNAPADLELSPVWQAPSAVSPSVAA